VILCGIAWSSPMRPKPQDPAATDDLFRHRLSNMLDQRHELRQHPVKTAWMATPPV
jgi:hypothetical protein